MHAWVCDPLKPAEKSGLFESEDEMLLPARRYDPISWPRYQKDEQEMNDIVKITGSITMVSW